MKPNSLLLACLAATLFISPASAQSGTSGSTESSATTAATGDTGESLSQGDAATGGERLNLRQKRRAKRVRQEMIQRFDADKDGKLNETERAKAVESRLNNPKAIKRFDTNADGKLDETEKAAAKEKIMAQVEKAKAR